MSFPRDGGGLSVFAYRVNVGPYLAMETQYKNMRNIARFTSAAPPLSFPRDGGGLSVFVYRVNVGPYLAMETPFRAQGTRKW